MARNNKKTKIESDPTRKHYIRFRALTTHPAFQKDVAELRNYLDLPCQGLSFAKENEYNNWFIQFSIKNNFAQEKALNSLRKLDQTIKKQSKLKIDPSKLIRPEEFLQKREEILLTIPENYLKHQIDFLITYYDLPYSFTKPLEHFILFNKIAELPEKNFDILIRKSAFPIWTDPEHVTEWNGFSYWMNVNIYYPLTGNEINELKNELQKKQNECFANRLLEPIKPQINIDEMIKLADAAEKSEIKIGQPKKEKEYIVNSDYFQRLKQSGFTKNQIKEILSQRKQNGEKISKKKVKTQKTSKNIAKELLHSSKKDSRIRKAKHLIKKLRKKLFIEN